MNHMILCLNGQFLPSDEAKLPVNDRGWRFGDGVFETIRLQEGVPYQWDLHMKRLSNGLEALRIRPIDADMKAAAREVIRQNGASDGFLRIGVSRGAGSIGYLPVPRDQAPHWVIEYLPFRPLPTEPLKLWVSVYTRPPLSALPVNHKLAHGIGSSLALMEAQDNQCDEALQLASSGVISSAASANIFWIKGKHIFTPSLATGCLAGTMRSAVMRCSEIPLHECEADLSTLENADAMFVTNCRLGIWPVGYIAPLNIAFNAEHPLIEELQQEIHGDLNYYASQNREYWSQS